MVDAQEKTKREVVEQLSWEPRVDASHVSVEVSDGVVTLKGEVPDSESRLAAEQAVWMADDVMAVDNRLCIKSEPSG